MATDGAGHYLAVWIEVEPAPPGMAANRGPLHIGYAYSADAGVTWSPPGRIPSDADQSDPVVAADTHGNFFVVWLDIFPRRIRLARFHLTEGFQPPIELSDPTAAHPDRDKPWITIDQEGNVLVTWIERLELPGTFAEAIVFAKGTLDSGFTRTVVTKSGEPDLPALCVDRSRANSPIFIAHLDSRRVVLRRSIDGGKTWAQVGPDSIAPFGDPSKQPARTDPECTVRGLDVWVSYGEAAVGTFGSNDEAGAVRLAHSTDGGTSFEPPALVSDGPAEAHYLIPQLTVRSDGALDLAYYQGVLDGPAVLVHAFSADGGSVWRRRSVAQAGAFPHNSHSNPSGLGDYFGLANDGDRAISAFGDNSTPCVGNSDGPHCTHIRFLAFPE